MRVVISMKASGKMTYSMDKGLISFQMETATLALSVKARKKAKAS